MKIALIGYGKMGRMIEQIAIARGHDVVCRIDIDNQQDFESAAFRSADVAIEFTAPSVAFGNIQKCFAAGVKVVSGSTGWFAQHEAEMRDACERDSKTLFWASNFSVGVAIFNAVNRYLAGIMNGFPEYDVELEETHHVHKLDHPSGTAITLANDIVERIDRKEAWAEDTTDPNLLRIDNIRRGEVPGIHTVRYDSEADLITITHDAHSRKGFALGAVLAAEYTANHQGLLGMKDMFTF
ncbi:MAG: 4-hydroxy-tetrahydrodipicolinate reductase [Bacteroidaceae bacterium]|nr:4-hydroxy-tetrahydrodipicolinate reductase [Bacteroidaceae bacterium]